MSKNCIQAEGSVKVVQDSSRFKTIVLNSLEVECLVDTGADVSIIKECVYQRLGDIELKKSTCVLRGLGSAKTIPTGEFSAAVLVDGVHVQQKFIVVADDKVGYNGLLGYDFVSKFCVVLDDCGFHFSRKSARVA